MSSYFIVIFRAPKKLGPALTKFFLLTIGYMSINILDSF
jgi:hypothetical protein